MPSGPRSCRCSLRDGLEELDRLNTRLEEAIRRARMVPVGPWFRQYERAVRDLARSHGKLARLVVVHGDVEVDTAVIERLRDVLTHLIRNGIDHGLEPPEVRKACGKDARGTITLRATHEGGGIALRVSDDGAGMSRARIAARASVRDLFGLSGPAPARESVVVVAHEGGQAGLVVDSLDGEGRTVIKPLGRLFRRTRGITGSTALADGRLALILDVDALMHDLTRGRAGGGALAPRARWRAPPSEARERAMDPEGRTR
ncbi:chemotaxis protein CheW [Sorangium sp. So ce117]|uniref:chemotaxis protein CheW n=1 Tax=Sorangium sp. So ce117 TaxID=3133277 RepID=UPI003F60CDED